MRAFPSVVAAAVLVGCTGGGKGVGTSGSVSGNLAPVIASVSLSPEEAYEPSLLTCSATGVTDSDGDMVTLSYSWQVNNTEVAGATGETLTGADFDKGDTVLCIATAGDGTQEGLPVTSNTVQILNTPPSATAVDVDPNPATPTNTLVATALGWSDPDPADTEDWSYAWYVNGASAGTDSDSLAGAFAKGDEVYVVATPLDGTDEGNPVQSDIVNIQNTPPELAAADLTPVSPVVSDVLTCSPSGAYDADGDTVTFAFAWFVNGSPAGSGTDILTAPQFARGDDVQCEVTPNDGTDPGTPVLSNIVTIGNSAPIIANVDLQPDPANELSTLTCTPTGITDPDGDPVGLEFAWTVGGLPVAATGTTLTGADFDKGQAVQCQVVADDVLDTAPPVFSNVVVIGNTPPSVTSGVVSPNPIYTDLDAGVTTYGWYYLF